MTLLEELLILAKSGVNRISVVEESYFHSKTQNHSVFTIRNLESIWIEYS